MKTIIITLLTIFLAASYSFSQGPPNKEIGIRFNDLNSYDLLFKKRLSDNTYRRLRLASLAINISGRESQDTRFSFAGNIAAGIEKRNAITDQFNFIYGWEGLLGLSLNRLSGENSGTYRAAIGAVIGWNYKLSNQITLGVEIIPSLTYTSSFGIPERIQTINLGYSTSSANLTATYGF